MAKLLADPADSTLQELRRGAIVVAILAQLRNEHYGYSLRERMAKLGLEVSEGTLYPLLRRLEGQGLLASRWEVGSGRPRRYYRISKAGERALSWLMTEWRQLVEAMARLAAEEGGD